MSNMDIQAKIQEELQMLTEAPLPTQGRTGASLNSLVGEGWNKAFQQAPDKKQGVSTGKNDANNPAVTNKYLYNISWNVQDKESGAPAKLYIMGEPGSDAINTKKRFFGKINTNNIDVTQLNTTTDEKKAALFNQYEAGQVKKALLKLGKGDGEKLKKYADYTGHVLTNPEDVNINQVDNPTASADEVIQEWTKHEVALMFIDTVLKVLPKGS